MPRLVRLQSLELLRCSCITPALCAPRVTFSLAP